jgi:predicted RNase H-like nuclease
VKFVGVDIAWSEKNPSGVAVINADGTIVRASGNIRTNQGICDFAQLSGGQDAIIAIDAPLIVKNSDKQRPVERELTQLFGLYESAPYPANLSNPAFRETGRIQQFVKVLERLGFEQQPVVKKQQAQRVFLEVFPSPAQVMLFPWVTHNGHGHCRPPRYKYKPKRSWVETQCEWEIYRARILSLRAKEPPLKFSAEVKNLLNIDSEGIAGVRYKLLDDLLDGIFCAYLSYHFWYWGADHTHMMGDTGTGYVLLPRCPLPSCEVNQSVEAQEQVQIPNQPSRSRHGSSD